MTTSWPTWRRSESLRAAVVRGAAGVAEARGAGARGAGSSPAPTAIPTTRASAAASASATRRRRAGVPEGGSKLVALPQRLAGGLAELGHHVAVDTLEDVTALVVAGVQRPPGTPAVRPGLARGLDLVRPGVQPGGGDPGGHERRVVGDGADADRLEAQLARAQRPLQRV